MNVSSRKRTLSSTTTIKHDDLDLPSVRDCSDLYAVAETVKCAFVKRCVPCAYKIATFDVSLDAEICQKVPNQRPECCPRSQYQYSEGTTIDERPLGYKHGMSVLTVGDGDFSFSLALSRMGCQVVATSYESKHTIQEVYNSVHVDDTLKELESLGATILYNVDATNLQGTLPASLVDRTFQRIIWNFPCSAVAKGQDGQNIEMDNNKQLVRDFLKNCQKFCPYGEIHINHKTKPPFNQWKINEVAVSNSPNIKYSCRVVLDRALFPPYIPRKALDRKSFPCHDACTYIFAVNEANELHHTPQTQQRTLDSTINNDLKSLENMKSCRLIPVTPDLIRQLRGRCLQYSANVNEDKTQKAKKRRRP